jgi:triosephosphate isomerase
VIEGWIFFYNGAISSFRCHSLLCKRAKQKDFKMKKLIAGNWKMNGSREFATDLADGLANAVGEGDEQYDMLICPPMLYIETVQKNIEKSAVMVGGQDCHFNEKGAHTGDTSPVMLKEMGCDYVILGHSERRANHDERNELIREKAKAAHKAGLVAIICVGEQEAERDAGGQNAVVSRQLAESIPADASADNTVIAYEPVWAIGTGKTATPEDVAMMHTHIFQELKDKVENFENCRILYGGSVKPANAQDILSTDHVGGVLVGGASLKVDDFMAIAKAA